MGFNTHDLIQEVWLVVDHVTRYKEVTIITKQESRRTSIWSNSSERSTSGMREPALNAWPKLHARKQYVMYNCVMHNYWHMSNNSSLPTIGACNGVHPNAYSSDSGGRLHNYRVIKQKPSPESYLCNIVCKGSWLPSEGVASHYMLRT